MSDDLLHAFKCVSSKLSFKVIQAAKSGDVPASRIEHLLPGDRVQISWREYRAHW